MTFTFCAAAKLQRLAAHLSFYHAVDARSDSTSSWERPSTVWTVTTSDINRSNFTSFQNNDTARSVLPILFFFPHWQDALVKLTVLTPDQCYLELIIVNNTVLLTALSLSYNEVLRRWRSIATCIAMSVRRRQKVNSTVSQSNTRHFTVFTPVRPIRILRHSLSVILQHTEKYEPTPYMAIYTFQFSTPVIKYRVANCNSCVHRKSRTYERIRNENRPVDSACWWLCCTDDHGVSQFVNNCLTFMDGGKGRLRPGRHRL